MSPRATAEGNQTVWVDSKLVGMAVNPADSLTQIFDGAWPAWCAGSG